MSEEKITPTADPILYYLRNADNVPVITVVLLEHPDGYGYARGVSICSAQDNFNYKRGRGIAKGRALKAVDTDTVPIFRNEIKRNYPDGWCIVLGLPVKFKSECPVNLTPHEQKLIKANKKAKGPDGS